MTAAADEWEWTEVLAGARVELHDRNVVSATAASLAAGTVVLVLLWSRVASGPLLAWWAALLAALGLRLAVRSARRAGALERDAAAWLMRHRAAYGLHGLIWGTLSVWALPSADPGALQVLTFVGAAMVGGSLVTGAFDLLAVLLFVVPSALPLVAGLAGLGGGAAAPELAVLMTVFLAIMVLASRRAAGLFLGQVRASHAERLEADEARRSAADAERARHELADQHRLLRQLVDSTPQGFWFVDPEGRTIDVNPAMCALLGRPRDAVLAGSAAEFFSGHQRELIERELDKLRAGKKGGHEVEIVRPDGTRAHAYNSVTPIVDSAGRQIGSIGLWTDLSPQKRAEEELRTYERLINSVSDLMAVIGPDRRWRLVNDAWCRASGTTRAHSLGRPLAEHPTFGGAEGVGDEVEHCFAGGHPVARVRQVVLADGRQLRLQISVQPIVGAAGQGVDSVIAIARDVTEQEADRAATQASAELLRRTLEATGDAIFASDATGPNQPVRLVNERMLRMWGLPLDGGAALTPAQIMAAAMPQFADPEGQAQHVAEVIKRNLADESIVRLRDGRVLHRRCTPAQGAAGALRVWTFRDITEQERAHEQLRHHAAELRAVLEAFPGYIAVLDAELCYLFVNRRVAALLGRDAADIVGRPARELLEPSVYAANERDLRRAATGEAVRTERHYSATASRGDLDLEITYLAGPPGPSGDRLFFAFGVDVTERKRVQLTLAAARDEAERANQAKSRFLSHMSHELRTPLNTIAGFAQLLARDRRSVLAAHQLEWVDRIRRGSTLLAQQIDELLDMARIEGGQLGVQLATVPLPELLAECVDLAGEWARERGVRLLPLRGLDPGATIAVVADAARLRQVLLNLLSNAIKHNREGGEVCVHCRDLGAEVAIEVHDNGPGLSEETRSRLFRPFERPGPGRGVIEGSGVGLLLSRHLVQAMQGRLGFDSRPGEGSVFWVRLPASRGAPPETAAAGGAIAGRRTATVLCIDDNPVNVMLVEAMLEDLPGLRLVSTSRPEEGLRLGRSQRPDLVLLDIHMPGLDGFQVLARLAAEPALADVPVVAISADAHVDDIAAALHAGFAAYLTKPIDMDELRATVKRLLAGADLARG